MRKKLKTLKMKITVHIKFHELNIKINRFEELDIKTY